ncbi:UNKNOWN [Stylonychia lemnae]|uniref:Tetratricopeptide repeat protein n=1 Tax=Stylonychia lemnae TaxID=5949 RepID=A0A078AKN6_STYLE|nr:UNKNOWN [Stylonychia lemnae]|eukprot:CDW82451.1 UNKNOWN [Stylonychia lemnae]
MTQIINEKFNPFSTLVDQHYIVLKIYFNKMSDTSFIISQNIKDGLSIVILISAMFLLLTQIQPINNYYKETTQRINLNKIGSILHLTEIDFLSLRLDKHNRRILEVVVILISFSKLQIMHLQVYQREVQHILDLKVKSFVCSHLRATKFGMERIIQYHNAELDKLTIQLSLHTALLVDNGINGKRLIRIVNTINQFNTNIVTFIEDIYRFARDKKFGTSICSPITIDSKYYGAHCQDVYPTLNQRNNGNYTEFSTQMSSIIYGDDENIVVEGFNIDGSFKDKHIQIAYFKKDNTQFVLKKFSESIFDPMEELHQKIQQMILKHDQTEQKELNELFEAAILFIKTLRTAKQAFLLGNYGRAILNYNEIAKNLGEKSIKRGICHNNIGCILLTLKEKKPLIYFQEAIFQQQENLSRIPKDSNEYQHI